MKRRIRPRPTTEPGSTRFVVTYDGPAVDRGTMDAGELGGAIVALAKLIDDAARLTAGATVKVETDVAADFRRGSFSFQVITSIAPDTLHQILQSITAHDILESIGLVGGGGGLIGLMRFLRGRKVKSVTPATSGDGTQVVTTTDGDSTVVSAQTVLLFQNSTVHMDLAGIVAPLRRDGIQEFRAGQAGEASPVVIRAGEEAFFEPPAPTGEELQDKTSVEIIQLVGLTFESGRKWRFRLADGTVFTSSLDDAFMKRVLSHEVEFGAGDALEADVRTVVIRDAGGQLHAKRDVIRVIRRIPAPRIQTQLDLGPRDRDDA